MGNSLMSLLTGKSTIFNSGGIVVYESKTSREFSGMNIFDECGKLGPLTHNLIGYLVRYYGVMKFVHSDWTLLDLGCGHGELHQVCYRNRHMLKYIGQDVNLKYLEEAVLKPTKEERLFVCKDAREPLPYLDSSFDCVAALELIEHMTPEEGLSMLNEIHRVLKVGGFLFLSTPIQPFVGDTFTKFHVHEYELDELRALLKQTELVLLATYGVSAHCRHLDRSLPQDEKDMFDFARALNAPPLINHVFAIKHPELSWDVMFILRRFNLPYSKEAATR